MTFLDLLENYFIIKEKDRELYYDVKDNVDEYKDFINESLSYDLIIKEDFIKLEKIPGVPEEWMGIKEFSEIKEYIFLLIILMFLEDKNKEEQFILSNITEYIENNYPNEKIDWTIFKNRKSLINVIKLLIQIGLIRRNDGDEENFSKSEDGEVLYESTGISRYMVRKFTKDIYNSENYEDLLNDAWEGVSSDKGIIRKNRVYRRILLSPVVYNDKDDDSDYEYIKNYRNYIKNTFEKYLEWNIHVHRNGTLVTLNNQNGIKDTFPNAKGESAIILLLSKKIRKLLNEKALELKENDTIEISESEFKEILLYVREEDGHGFTKSLRECSEEFFINSIKNYMREFSMLKINDNTIIIMPLIGKIVGNYPKDYKVGE